MVKNLLLYVFILLLSACFDATPQGVCHDDNKVERPCTEGEVRLINFVHELVKNAENFEAKDIDSTFKKTGPVSNVKDARLLLFGEYHDDWKGRIAMFAAFNALLGKNDIVLYEGDDRSARVTEISCVEMFIREVYTTHLIEEANAKFDDPKNARIVLLARVGAYMAHTEKSYDLSRLNLQNVPCGFWDDKKAFEEGLSAQSLIKRNDSMVAAIKDNLKKYGKVAVMAGAAHLPLGDVLLAEREQDKRRFVQASREYYDLVKQQRNLPKDSRTYKINDVLSGTTEAIFEYLRTASPAYVEMLPWSIFRK